MEMENVFLRKVHYSHLYLCGHLDTNKSSEVFFSEQQNGWIKDEIEEDIKIDENGFVLNGDNCDYTYKELCNMYYESFVDSLVSVKNRSMLNPYNETAHYTLEVNKVCKLRNLKLSNNEWDFKVLRLHLFFFPYNICLFAIEIEDGVECNANDLTFAHLCLRDVNNYMGWVEKKNANGKKYKEWGLKLDAPDYLDCIKPLLELCSLTGKYENQYSRLTLTGNKLKSFQIVLTDNTDNDFLYELGTLSPIGCVNNHLNFLSPSKEYYDKLMKENTISVFRNWKALALFDTFTVVINSNDPERTLFPWRNFYFRLIYVHSLFQKTMLFIVNRKFRSDQHVEECRGLLQDMKVQEHWYAFSNISYNFLPQLIYKSIDYGLEIGEERESLRRYIEQESERLDKQNEFRIGKLVFYITVITIFSALYDGTSLFREFFGINIGGVCYKVLVFVFVVLILLGYWLLYARYKKIKG